MDKFVMIDRTKRFAINTFKLIETFPNNKPADVIARQVLRSASSVAANYRAACRAKSKADFINKMKIVEEEADESLFWLEFTKDLSIKISTEVLDNLIKEGHELVAIFTQALKTLKSANPASDNRTL